MPDGVSSPGPCPQQLRQRHALYSFHPGGTHLLFGDGAVRLIPETTEMRVVARLVTRAGREVRHMPFRRSAGADRWGWRAAI
jgi:prepilin-type processing-associated H-X9-DG protein